MASPFREFLRPTFDGSGASSRLKPGSNRVNATSAPYEASQDPRDKYSYSYLEREHLTQDVSAFRSPRPRIDKMSEAFIVGTTLSFRRRGAHSVGQQAMSSSKVTPPAGTVPVCSSQIGAEAELWRVKPVDEHVTLPATQSATMEGLTYDDPAMVFHIDAVE